MAATTTREVGYKSQGNLIIPLASRDNNLYNFLNTVDNYLVTTSIGAGGSTKPPSVIVGGGGAGKGFIQEIPQGAIDGENAVFTLTEAPSGILVLFLNGIQQLDGVDYTLVADTITYTVAPMVGDWHVALLGTSQPGATAPGDSTEVIFNLNGKFAASPYFRYVYGSCVITGQGTVGFIGPTFNSTGDVAPDPKSAKCFQTSQGDFVVYGSGDVDAQTYAATTVFNSLSDRAPDPKSTPAFQTSYGDYIVWGSGDVQGQTFAATTVFNSAADKQPNPWYVAAFQTSGGDFIVYGSGDVQGQTFKATTTFNSLADRISPSNPDPSVMAAFQTSGGDFIAYGSGDVQGQTFKANTTFNSLADQAPIPRTTAAFQTQGGDFVVFGSGDMQAQSLRLTLPFAGQICFMVADALSPNQGFLVSGDPKFTYDPNTGFTLPLINISTRNPGDVALIVNNGAAEIYGDGSAQFQRLSLTTPISPQICFMRPTADVPQHGYFISGDPAFLYTTVGAYTGVVAPLFNATNSGIGVPAIVVNQGAAEIWGSGDAQFQTVKLTTPTNTQVCFMSGTLVSGSPNFVYTTIGGYTGLIAPLFNASNATAGSPCFIAGQGAAEIYGDGTAQFQSIKLTTPTNTQICYMSGTTLSGSGNFTYNGADVILTTSAGHGITSYAFSSNATGGSIGYQLANQAFLVDGNGNVNCNASIPGYIAFKNQGAPATQGGFGYMYADTGGIHYSVNGGPWQVLGAGVTGIYAGTNIAVNVNTGNVTVSISAPGGNQVLYGNGGLASNGWFYWGGDNNLYVNVDSGHGIISRIFNSLASGTESALVVNNQIIVNGRGDVSAPGTLYALGNLSISGFTSSAGSCSFNGYINTASQIISPVFTWNSQSHGNYNGAGTDANGLAVQCTDGWHSVRGGLII